MDEKWEWMESSIPIFLDIFTTSENLEASIPVLSDGFYNIFLIKFDPSKATNYVPQECVTPAQDQS